MNKRLKALLATVALVASIIPYQVLGGAYSDDFEADTWTTIGSKIYIQTANNRLWFEAEQSSENNSVYKLFGAINSTEFKTEYSLYSVSTIGIVALGMFETPTNFYNYQDDAVAVQLSNNSIRLKVLDEGVVAGSTSAISYGDGVLVYLRTERVLDNFTLSVFSDATMTTHLTGSPQTIQVAGDITPLNYFQVVNYANGAGANLEEIGYIKNLLITSPDPPVVEPAGSVHVLSVSVVQTKAWNDPGSYANNNILLQQDIRIIGWRLAGYASSADDNNAIKLGVMDMLAILSRSSDPADVSARIAGLQGTDRFWSNDYHPGNYDGSATNNHELFKDQVIIFPGGYGIDMDAGERIYIHSYGRNNLYSAGAEFAAGAMVYYVLR